MKKIILLIAFTISSSNLLSQKDTKILVTINDNEFSVADFKKVYEKNLDAIDSEDAKSVTKNLESNSLILRSNKILVNKSEISADSLLPLIVQKKNNYFIGFPVGAKLYESSKKNSDSLFDNWIKTKKNKEKKLNSIFSIMFTEFANSVLLSFLICKFRLISLLTDICEL